MDSPCTPDSVELPLPTPLSLRATVRKRTASTSCGGLPISRKPWLIPGSLEEAKRYFARLPPAPPGRKFISPMSQIKKKVRRCHGCHGENDEEHESIPMGAEKCTLLHSVRCPGGIGAGVDGKGKLWRACPLNYTGNGLDYDVEVSENEEDETEFDQLSSKMRGVSISGELTLSTSSSSLTTSLAALGAHGSSSSSTVSTSSVKTPAVSTLTPSMQLKEDLARLQKEREALEEQVVLQRQQTESAEVVELKRKLQAERDRVAQLKKSAMPSIPQSDILRKQHPQNTTDFTSSYSGPTIKEIRKVKSLKDKVEYQVEDIRREVPSLGRRPSVTSSQDRVARRKVITSSQSNPVKPKSQQDKDFEEFKQFRAWKAQCGAVAATDSDSDATPPRPQTTTDPVTDASSSEDEGGQPLILVYRRDAHGRKYRSWEPYLGDHEKDTAGVDKYIWVKDPATGREYREAVLTKRVDHRVVSETPGAGHKKGVRSPQQHSLGRKDRVPGIIPLETREGKPDDKKPSIIDWVRNCPVNYAEKVKFDDVNLPLWVWGYVSELLASRTGLSPDLPPGELEARLQHLLCVLQVALVHSEKTEFMSKGWSIAGVYAKRVQQKLDRGLESWQDFSRFGHDPHPSEMFSAKTEVDRKAPVKKRKEEERYGDRYGGGKGKLCSTWNNSDVEGKCKYMVNNPSATKCINRHDCSYCLEKGLGTFMHQSRFCRKKRDANDD